MDKIEKRDFELCSETGSVIIICMMPISESSQKCINDIDSLNLSKNYIKTYSYDISTDYERIEKLSFVDKPIIFLYKNGEFRGKFEYTGIDDFKNKVKNSL